MRLEFLQSIRCLLLTLTCLHAESLYLLRKDVVLLAQGLYNVLKMDPLAWFQR